MKEQITENIESLFRGHMSAFLTKSADGGRNPPAVDEIAIR